MSTNLELIKKFDKIAMEYDQGRELLIPKFNDFYNTLAELTQNKENPKILDLGTGTGLLTKFLLGKHPNSEFILIDMSKEMLKIAKNRFKSNKNIRYIQDNYLDYKFDEKFDIIVSSLSIHHLSDNDKQKLNKKIFEHLNPNGKFINADEVKGPTKKIEEIYQSTWMNKIDTSGIDENYKREAIERIKYDDPATLLDNLAWLKDIGFVNVDVIYKYYNFVVLYSEKPSLNTIR